MVSIYRSVLFFEIETIETPDLKRVLPLGMRLKHLICDKLYGCLFSAEVVTVEDLITPASGWVTYFKYPLLGYEGPEAVDGIDLCCPDVRKPYGMVGIWHLPTAMFKFGILERMDKTTRWLRA